jgi:nucleolar complex protein 2
MQRTGTYIPIAPFLLEILDSSEMTRKPKGSSLKPLDWTYYLRAPAAYTHTRVYADGLIDEVAYLLLEFLATQSTSIAFPELCVPILVTIRKHIKKSKNPKLSSAMKALVERIETNSRWIEEKRSKVEFSPQDREQVDAFLLGEEGSPLRTYLKLQKKVREQKRELLEKSLADDEDDEGPEAEDEEMEEDE